MTGAFEGNAFNTGGQPQSPSNLSSDAAAPWLRPASQTISQDSSIGAPPGDQSAQTAAPAPSAPWRATYGNVAPAFTSGVEHAQPQPTNNAPWRATYGSVAPAFMNGVEHAQPQPSAPQAAPWNSAPTSTSTEVDPNRNGNQPTGPKWQPHVQYNWNSAGPASANPTGVPGMRPGSGAPAAGPFPTDRPAKDNLYDPHIAGLDTGMQHGVPFGGSLVIGGVAGVLAGGPLPYFLNHTAETIVNGSKPSLVPQSEWIPESGIVGKVVPASWREGANDAAGKAADFITSKFPGEDSAPVNVAKWYQNHFDSRFFSSNKLVIKNNQFNQLNDKVQGILADDNQKLNALRAANPDLDEASVETRQQLRLLQERTERLASPEWNRVLDGKSYLDQLKALQRGATKDNPAPFSQAEMDLLTARQDARTSIEQLNSAKGEMSPFLGEKGAGSNFLKAAGFVGVTMIANNYLDRLVTGKDHKTGLTDSSVFTGVPYLGTMSKSWHTNELLLPLAFASGGWSGKAIFSKAALTVAAMAGGKALDVLLPPSAGLPQYSNLLAPNGTDAFLQGAAWLLPASDNKVRMAMIGGAWAIGRICNLFEGPSQADLKDEGFSKMQKDMSERTSSSMESSMDAFKKLGAKSDGNLRDYAIEWSRPNRAYTSLLSDYRGVVILDGASAESRLEAGTLIPGSTTEYTLAGKGLDLGGQALHTFKAAQSGIAHAKAQTQADMGKTIDGKVVTQSELDDLDKVNDRMNSIIQNQIYGKHDIQSCVDQIGHDLGRNDTRGAERLRMDIDNSLALNRNSADKQLVAKLFRDRATLDLGVAQFELNGPNASQADILVNGDANHSGRQSIYNDGQQRGYDGAIDEIALAKQYDPTNPDLPQLEAIAARLEQGIPGGVQKQQSNPIFNPNNVNDQVNHPGLQSKI